MARFMIAAAHKSSGKTTVSIGLTAAMTQSGRIVQPFKKGPDYIDPMWLGRAARRPCYNLDFNTMTHAEIVRLVGARAAGADVRLIEANKGLFDGVDLEGSDSNAALATLLDVPVLLVLDTVGTTRGIAPLIQGYIGFDDKVTFLGVILNKVGGPRHEGKLRAAIEHYTDVPVLGAVGRDDELAISERHLGLTTPGEVSLLDDKIANIAAKISSGIDMAAILDLARGGAADAVTAPAVRGANAVTAAATSARQAEPEPSSPLAVSAPGPVSAPSPVPVPAAARSPLRIGIARDAAFGFYYPDDMEALEAAGAELVPINSMRDAGLPDIDGLFIGGGFPETNAAPLAANKSLRTDIRRAIEGGLPTYAECGGLMYLCRSIHWDGVSHDMLGVIPGVAVMNKRPQGRGYARLRERAEMPWPQLAGAGAEADAEQPAVTATEQIAENAVAGASAGRQPHAQQAPMSPAGAHLAPQFPAPHFPSHEFPAHEFHYAGLQNLEGDPDFAYDVLRGHGIDGVHDGIVMHNALANFAHLRDTGVNHWCRRFVAFIRQKRR